jgi:hypothetical protein
MGMFSQVTKTFTIPKHVIHRETILDFTDLPFRREFFSAEDLERRREAFSSYNELSPDCSKSTSEMFPTRAERS